MTERTISQLGLNRELPISFVLMGGLVGTRSDGSMKMHSIRCISRGLDDWKRVSGVETFDSVAPQLHETNVVPRDSETGGFYVAAGRGWSLTGDTTWLPIPPSASNTMIAGYVRSVALHFTRALNLPYIYVQIGDKKGRLLGLSSDGTKLIDLRQALLLRDAAALAAAQELAPIGQKVLHA